MQLFDRSGPDRATYSNFEIFTIVKEIKMSRISEVMTRDVRVIAPHESLQRAAQVMDELNVGALPVCDGEKLAGMATDRDIVVRAVSAGMPVDSTPVSEVMSTGVEYCYEDEDVEDVMDRMRNVQIRRVPVMDRQERLVGMVSLGDIATKSADENEVKDTLEGISQPSQPDRSSLH
jgi:CBS domain-containing protein